MATKKTKKTAKKKKKTTAKNRGAKVLSTKDSEKLGKAVKEGGLRLAWIRFIDAYIANGGNGTKAYIKAYSIEGKVVKESTARANAAVLLANTSILEELNNKLSTQKVTDEFISAGLMEIATKYRGAKTINAAVKSYEILAKMRGLLVDTKKIAFTGDNPALFPALVKEENKEKFDEMVKNKQRIAE